MRHLSTYEALAVNEQRNAAIYHRLMVNAIERGDLECALWHQRDAAKAARQARFNLLICLGYDHNAAWEAAR